VRVPLASGMLTGKYHKDMTFASGDHRNFNRNGAGFDKGETFSGIDFNSGLDAVEELKKIFPNQDLAVQALKWILMFKEVSCIIPGASRVDQLESNLKAIEGPSLKDDEIQKVAEVYNRLIKNQVHHLW
jgi:aryl-alcohol dehydrogenase-like predicted oxidoreductase